MLLSKLTDNFTYDVEITGLSCNSKEVKPGDLFFAINGYTDNGGAYAYEAVEHGAVAVVTNQMLNIQTAQVIVSDVRESMSLISKKFYGNASDELIIVAITGTNGKTSTTYILNNILICAGKKTGVIGTLGAKWADKHFELKHTTPDPVELHRLFRLMRDDGIRYVIMETSAHAIYLKKLAGIKFRAGIITNITQDHLDFFKGFDEYAKTKLEFINSDNIYYSIVNADKINYQFKKPSVTYGIVNPSDVFAIDIADGEKCSFVINIDDEIYNIVSSLHGLFNVYNMLAAAAAAKVLNIPGRDIAKGLCSMREVEGRFNVVSLGSSKIIVDYAHTPDGLTNLLTAAKAMNGNRIICLFGCGGDRDKTKRPIMGRIAESQSDYVIVTSDNPRTEDPLVIIRDINEGFNTDSKHINITDRREAICFAVSMIKHNDVVVIAGKGAENYIEKDNVRTYFNDMEEVKKLIGENIGTG